MKQLTTGVTYKTFVTLLMLLVIQTITWAQDGGSGGSSSSGGGSSSSGGSSVTHTTTTSSSDWYAQPWVWVVGAIVLILLLVALLRGNSGTAVGASRTDRVTVTKTTDSDVI